MAAPEACLPGYTLTQRYALAVAMTLARRPRTVYVPVTDLAEDAHAPAPFLAKVLHALAEARVVEGRKGHHGGYRLARNADRITLAEVIGPFCDGASEVAPCVMGARACTPGDPCALHTTWGAAMRPVRELLGHTTLADVVRAEHSAAG